MQDITGLLVTHQWAEVSDLEQLCKPDTEEVLRQLIGKEGVEEAFVIQTCNRAEFYASGEGSRDAIDEFAESADVRDGLAKRVDHSEAVRHIMRLACGLESMVIGEDEILGQVRDAYHTAYEEGCLSGTLKKTVMKAIHLGERARTETRINEGNASMGSAAVELAREYIGDLSGIKVVVIGAGDMGELVAKSLLDRGNEYDEIVVANRTYERADHLADEIGGTPIKFADLTEHLDDADMVVSATSAPHLIFDRSDLEGHRFLLLDLANPRDVDEAAEELDSVELVDIDDLAEVSDSSRETRKKAAEKVEKMIDDEMDVLEQQFKEERAMEILSAIYSRAEGIRQEETQRAIDRLESKDDLTEDEKEVIDDLTSSIVNKLLSTPTQALKNAAVSEDYETLRSASHIFRLEDVDVSVDLDGEDADDLDASQAEAKNRA